MTRLTRTSLLALVALVAAAPAGASELDPKRPLLPFPSDEYTVADKSTDTGLRVNLSLLDMPRNIAGKPIDPTDFNRADGFSPGQPILTHVPGLDLGRTGAVPITDMARYADADAPILVINTKTGERHPIWAELDANASDPADRALIIRPAVNFEEATRYVVVLRDLRDSDGDAIAPRSSFANRVGKVNGTGRGRAVGIVNDPIWDDLTGAGVALDDSLYLAWDFTVASADSIAGRMLQIRDDAFKQLGDTNLADLTVQGKAPTFTVDEATDFPTGDIAREVTGTFLVPCYLNTPGCIPGSRFAFSPTSDKPVAVPGNVMRATYTCRIPRWALADGGRATRPSLYGHGLLGGQGEVTAGNVSNMANEHGITFCATDWYGMATEDIVTVATILPDMSNFPALADRVQQGMLAQLFLGRLMVHPDGFAAKAEFQVGGKRLIDTTRLFYDGNSQGGIIGGSLAAVAVDHERAVLGVPGMNYSTLLNRSVDWGTGKSPDPTKPDIPEYAWPYYTAYPSKLDQQIGFSLIQMLWDRAEANGYAHHMTSDPYPNTPRHEVLLHVALGDHQVAPVSADVEARTIGAQRTVSTPYGVGRTTDVDPMWGIPLFDAASGAGSALVVWDSGSPVPPTGNVPPMAGRDPHGHPRGDRQARVQKSEFLKVDGRLVDVCGGGPCRTANYTPPPPAP